MSSENCTKQCLHGLEPQSCGPIRDNLVSSCETCWRYIELPKPKDVVYDHPRKKTLETQPSNEGYAEAIARAEKAEAHLRHEEEYSTRLSETVEKLRVTRDMMAQVIAQSIETLPDKALSKEEIIALCEGVYNEES